MKSICFYFQVHQPYRLTPYRVQDIGEHREYFDEEKNKAIFEKVRDKCYLPTNELLLRLCERYPEFRASFSLSGVFLEQCEQYDPEVLKSFQRLVETGQVEILSETYYHSLAGLYSKEEFAEQVLQHRQLIKKYFGLEPTVFRNTELVYSNEIAEFIRLMGFQGILAEGADHILDWRRPNHLYAAKKCDLPTDMKQTARRYNIHDNPRKQKKQLPLLLKNYKLSDDIAFRFSNKGWKEYPLNTEKFASWLSGNYGETINLFMDYETFGEHQWADTGIFAFLEHLPEATLKHNISFRTPSETIQTVKPIAEIDMHHPVSWADMERDLSAWRGNEIQHAALDAIYSLEGEIKGLQGRIRKAEYTELLTTWRKLQTSDQFYYMSTKYWSDGDVHKYFSPFDSPYDAYIYFMNVMTDLHETVKTLHKKSVEVQNFEPAGTENLLPISKKREKKRAHNAKKLRKTVSVKKRETIRAKKQKSTVSASLS